MTGPVDADALERLVGRVLGIGVRVSGTLLGIGLLLALANELPRASDTLLRTGLLTLMITPSLRVIISVFEYARARDWPYVVTTGAVLAVLVGTVITAAMEWTGR